MKNNISIALVSMAIISFFILLYQLYVPRTDWAVATISGMSSFILLGIAYLSEQMANIELRNEKLIELLTHNLTKMGMDSSRSWVSSIPITFSFTRSTDWPSKTDLYASMSLEELENERLRAEKEENYELAEKIRQQIEARKS